MSMNVMTTTEGVNKYAAIRLAHSSVNVDMVLNYHLMGKHVQVRLRGFLSHKISKNDLD